MSFITSNALPKNCNASVRRKKKHTVHEIASPKMLVNMPGL